MVSAEPTGGEKFASKARTVEGWYEDYASHLLSSFKQDGTISQSWGVTRPVESIRDSMGLMSAVRGWMGERSQRFGGGYLNPEQYLNERFKSIAGSEGYRSVVYKDHNGLNTIGNGFNMDQPNARSYWDRAGLAKDGLDFDAVKSGRLGINKDHARRLFDAVVEDSERIVRSRTQGVRLADHERLALVSLAYNNPVLISEPLVQKLRSGDRKAVAEHILSNFNPRRMLGVARRRWHEAATFAGSEAKNWLPDYKQYTAQYA